MQDKYWPRTTWEDRDVKQIPDLQEGDQFYVRHLEDVQVSPQTTLRLIMSLETGQDTL